MTEAEIARLEADIAATLGHAHAALVRRRAAEIVNWNLPGGFEKLVADVQQEILDLHLSTSWPPCPSAPQHPLWFSEGAWRCPVHTTIAIPIGSLAPPPKHPPRAQ